MITIEQVNASLVPIRKMFNSMNGDLQEKINIYRKEHCISANLGDYCWDYIRFAEVLEKGFQSYNLQLAFEILLYLHFFRGLVVFGPDPIHYIKDGVFDEAGFMQEGRNNAEVLIALNLVEGWIKDLMLTFEIKKPEELLSDPKMILDCLKSIQYGKDRKLHYFGDVRYIVSKIPLADKPGSVFDSNIKVNRNIFYTNSPAQIVQFAQVAPKGVYIIANVPYDHKADTAFYVLFRQDDYAYLVENAKHSYRDQFYRTRIDGTPGEDAWLEKKYEYDYFPVDLVLDFFEKSSKSKDLVNKKELGFITLGALSECEPAIVLWNYAFIDSCISHFVKDDFIKQITVAATAEFILPHLIENKSEISSIPVVYTPHLPQISSLDVTWNPKTVGVDDYSTVLPIIQDLRPVVLNKVEVPTGKLTSIEHVRREIIFRQRIAQADQLQRDLDRGFKKNYRSVWKQINDFVVARKDFVIKRALENNEYKFRTYSRFATKQDEIPEGEGVGFKASTILSVDDSKGSNRDGTRSIIRPNHFQRHEEYLWRSQRTVPLEVSAIRWNDSPCYDCRGRFRYFLKLQFIDYIQFKDFFNLTEDEEKQLPEQLKKYLNQSNSLYYGNSILDDVDPVVMVSNPWWKSWINDDGNMEESRRRDNPAVFISFELCGRCLRRRGFSLKK